MRRKPIAMIWVKARRSMTLVYDDNGLTAATRPENHGKTWSKAHQLRLDEFCKGEITLTNLAEQLGRTRYAVYCQLQRQELIVLNPGDREVPMYATLVPPPDEYQGLPATAIVSRAKVVTDLFGGVTVEYGPRATPYTQTSSYTPTHSIQKETTMKTVPTIETRTFIQGHDAASMSDMEIFNLIESLTTAVNGYKARENRADKLNKLIVQTEADIAALIKYVDGR